MNSRTLRRLPSATRLVSEGTGSPRRQPGSESASLWLCRLPVASSRHSVNLVEGDHESHACPSHVSRDPLLDGERSRAALQAGGAVLPGAAGLPALQASREEWDNSRPRWTQPAAQDRRGGRVDILHSQEGQSGRVDIVHGQEGRVGRDCFCLLFDWWLFHRTSRTCVVPSLSGKNWARLPLHGGDRNVPGSGEAVQLVPRASGALLAVRPWGSWGLAPPPQVPVDIARIISNQNPFSFGNAVPGLTFRGPSPSGTSWTSRSGTMRLIGAPSSSRCHHVLHTPASFLDSPSCWGPGMWAPSHQPGPSAALSFPARSC
nr:PREDICTED: uncharacterized protein LOC103563477 [Equus przewalskii]XP_008537091.1 PREDICTED: uncharacterized protein LOC103563477 [Equus przewalskii]